MIYKSFTFNIILRTILILLVCIIFAFTILTTEYLFTITLLAFVITFQLWEIIYFINKSNRKLNRFLEQYNSPKQTNASTVIPYEEKGIDQILQSIKNIIKEKSIKAETQFYYLQSVVDNTQSGILSFNKSNFKIEFINKTALNYFGIKSLSSLEYLKNKHPHIWETITKIQPGEQKIESLNTSSALLQLSIKSSIIKFMDRSVQIVSIHNIQAELEENELESWRKLVRVFTHEISNSIAPISSITNSLIKLLHLEDENISEEKLNDSISGLKSIQNRSQSLKSFIERFRNLTRIPQINATSFRLRELLESTYILFEEELYQKNIHLQIDCNNEIKAFGDQHLLEQVVINLIKNAIQAADKEDAEIIISASKNDNGKIRLRVIDNGQGIADGQIKQIFIPFFTTKEEGSGIGLSLCRQIIHLHKGRIGVESKKGEGSTFTLDF